MARWRDLGVSGSSRSSHLDWPASSVGCLVDSLAGVFANDDILELEAWLGDRSTG